MSAEVPKDFAPRLCHVVKWPDFQGYGFNLHAERGKAGQFIGKVDEKSPAEASGLKEGDRIVEVNGVNIGNENHQQVVTRIRAGGDETRLLVVDSASDEWFKNNKTVIKGDLPGVIFGTARRDETVEEAPVRVPTPEPEATPEPEPSPVVDEAPVTNGNDTNHVDDDAPKPRLCHLKLWPHFQGYGFNLHAERDKPGQFIGLVDDNSPASTAGLRVNDRIVEVNGQNVEKKAHAEVITAIKSDSQQTRLLVVDPPTDTYYRERGIAISKDMSNVEYIVTPTDTDDAPSSEPQLDANEDLDSLPPPPADDIPPPPPEDEEEKEETKKEEVSEQPNGIDAVDVAIAESEPVSESNDVPEPVSEPVESEPQEPQTTEDEPESVYENVDPPEDTVNGVKKEEASPEPEFTVAKQPEVHQEPPAPTPQVEAPKPASTGDDEGLMLNLSVAEMKERLKAKKKQDPRQNKISFERKYQQFERM